jgi:cell wall-associated NlpC family hydrolase
VGSHQSPQEEFTLSNLDKYINLKFRYKGRDFSGVDCYGLVRLVLKNERQIKLPEYEYSQKWYFEGKNYIVEIKNDSSNWSQISTDKINPFDVILFYSSPKRIIVNHMGVYIGEEKFLHVSENHNSMVDRLSQHWISRVYAIMRYSKEV